MVEILHSIPLSVLAVDREVGILHPILLGQTVDVAEAAVVQAEVPVQAHRDTQRVLEALAAAEAEVVAWGLRVVMLHSPQVGLEEMEEMEPATRLPEQRM
jgi:hypothetical protein